MDVVKNTDTIRRVYNVHLQSIKLSSQDLGFINGDSITGSEATMAPIMNKLKYAYTTRATQAEKISEHALNSPFPVITSGDFNDTPMSYVYNCVSTLNSTTPFAMEVGELAAHMSVEFQQVELTICSRVQPWSQTIPNPKLPIIRS